ncbi:MAG: DUF4433 domain-containing protein [Legionellales bacterium]|nr:DUF4433 domain-containing protein [Legionellales bacterium]
MIFPVPNTVKIYHILHVDRLSSVFKDGYLWSDAKMINRRDNGSGTTIGMTKIKLRRLNELTLNSYQELYVGSCVPFYFCPRSVMLYILYQANHNEISYKGGQEPIVHLVSDLYKVTEWAEKNNKRWVFTLSNAGSRIFEDRNCLSQLNELNWPAINSQYWHDHREEKQAEFLLEDCMPIHLIEQISVYSKLIATQVNRCLESTQIEKPNIVVRRDWYY